ncbi:aldehyde dehydrogenase [Pseudomonas aeruginosa PA38182]|nr:aldehyde dehydrogenase [Pseudomonas aeruginosa PA38182]
MPARAQALIRNLTKLNAVTETWDNGKAVRETLNADIPLAADHFRYFAGCIRAQEGSAAEINDSTVAYHIHEPLGVVGQIIPWNFPLLMAAWKLAPALAAGNCVVLKPAEQTPLGICVLLELIGDLLPPGVLNVVQGFGVCPRPRREPGRWPACCPLPPASAGRRTADLPPALPTCLSTLETKPLSRFFGALGRMRKSSSRRSVMAVLSASSGVSGRGRHADIPALARAARHARHGGEAAPCRSSPTCRLMLRASRCRPLLSCLPFLLCPAPLASAARRLCCTSSQPVCKCANGRRPDAFEARHLHAGQLRRVLREAWCGCARDARATTRQQQRIGDHHGCVSGQIGRATPITADVLTGPK